MESGGLTVNRVRPLISVVVPTYNSEGTLPHTLESLAAQSWRDFEVIVKDGASRDGTMSIAESFAATLPSLRIESASDAGVYDAINQAWEMARGEWVLVLGSDDRLHASNTLEMVAKWLLESSAGVVYGDVKNVGPNAVIGPVGTRYAGPMPLHRLLRHNICQQAIFYRRTLVHDVGPFDLRYPVWADWHFNIRVALQAPMEWVDMVIADYSTAGLSSTGRGDGFTSDLPTLVLEKLLQYPLDRRLWPSQRHLLRFGNQCRKRGEWALAIKLWSSFVSLRLKRLGLT